MICSIFSVLGVANEVAILHEFTGVFVEDSGQDFLGVLTACKGAGAGDVFTDVEGGQDFLLHILVESFAESGVVDRVVVIGRLFMYGIVCRGVFVGFDCGPCDGGYR